MVWRDELSVLKQSAVMAVGLAIFAVVATFIEPTGAALFVLCLAFSTWASATICWFGPGRAKPTLIGRLGFVLITALSAYSLVTVTTEARHDGFAAHANALLGSSSSLVMMIVFAVQRERRGRRERAA